jgi:hypothetical protein
VFLAEEFRIFCTTIVIALLSAVPVRAAQHPYLQPVAPPQQQQPASTTPAEAPVPVGILDAKKVFISNAGGELKDWFTGGPNRLYNQFYSAMKEWGRYDLVATPADADLIFEIHASGLYLSEKEEIPKFELTIYDPKTHVILWAFAERLDLALLKGHRDQNFEKAVDALLARTKELVEGH